MTVQLLRRTVLGLVATVAGVLLTLASAAPATGHAMLLGTDPADGDVLTAPPDVVTLTFNEPVQADDGSVRLLDAAGEPIAAEARPVDDTVEITVPADLPEGSYVVDWSVVSADGHPVGGAFTFAVGRPSTAVAEVAAPTGDPLVDLLHQGAQVFVYLGILGTSGLVLFRTVLLDRGAGIVHAPVLRLATVFAAAALGGLLVYLAADGAWRTGSGLPGLVDPGTLWDTLTGTPVGTATVVALVGLVLALGAGATPAGRAVTCAGALLALLSLPLAGHSRSFGPAWLVLGSDAVHVSAGAVWFGGVLGLVITLRSSAPASAAARTVGRFSTAALWVVLALAATGTVLAWRILPDLAALTSTGYGLTLLAKVAVVGVVVLVAAWNRYRLVPHVGDDDGARARLRRTVGTEAWLILLAVTLTGVLVSQSPTDGHTAPAAARPVAEHVALGDGMADVRVAPARVGANVVEIELNDADGEPLEPAADPQVRLSLPEQDLGPLTPALTRTGTGRYELPVDLPLPGGWELELSVRTSTFDNPVVVVPVEVVP
ncbi:copper transport protein [Georgenia satyanarayanai]|uniref:Copper transport protein n=1 Tax=Georgenia satyanarayanai TaxID=860221 RepID=A0A2Y9A9K8_9MICO|nr:FixH family protein [Georgenia satyanarayanai]PYG00559.1 copper transport protein [Georgenia satyanarayanai]SSA39948.1 copper transport protein [Georgenia satyanarayanai]